MAKIEGAVSDSGHLIHLAQINLLKALKIAKKIYIPDEVYAETCSSGMPGSKKIKSSKIISVKSLNDSGKDMAKIISEKYSLDVGEAQCIALAIQENIKLFITDDLSARIIAENHGLEVHGSVGIILRAFGKEMLSKKAATQAIADLKEKSSLFITADLVKYAQREIDKFAKRRKS